MNKQSDDEKEAGAIQPTCFVLMPISDPDGYLKGHFKHVYDDVIAPACQKAGFKAVRADQVKQSNLIHLDILQKLLEAPMALCDLSSRNPNVLFELALRQSFDKPVALVQEVGTPPVFDISPFRYAEYRKDLTYHEVLEDQNSITKTIKETFDAYNSGKGVNSIVKLLALSKPASLPSINAPEASANIQQLILAELSQLRQEVRNSRRDTLTAHRAFKDQTSSELPMLLNLLHETEIRIMNCADLADIDRASTMLEECRYRLMRHIENMNNLPSSERQRVSECEIHLEMLRRELSKAAEKLQQRNRK